ncbi:biotin--[acetyl-CoA-carboxylase] ligase [Propionibacterium australiense]|uniref:biotin--[biotin carboxyl-carrier protein] ligase n=1 Tax=Propionibacterium australiense TaxID=119981 RepID=A0A8B3FMB4_9ACTN|nr:biotin--[acetyl-CoA-carboxylase] ligase [Propionibacterium australiense]RLP13117.1 biotin--[acetyl-CoA-carboxylase] ligase [Propionibacterium australiense]
MEWYERTGSTNEDLADRARTGARPGLVLVAEYQSVGRARFDRRWQGAPGTSIAVSVLVAPRPEPARWGWLSILVGLAVREGVESCTGAAPGRVSLKWPNDVLLDGRKICGILCERVGDLAVLGWGLNISMDEDELPVPTATSLYLAGLPCGKDEVTAHVLTSLQRWFEQWQRTGQLRREFMSVCATIGSAVRLHQDVESATAAVVEGTAVGVDETGAILIEDAAGRRRAFGAGDVIHLR